MGTQSKSRAIWRLKLSIMVKSIFCYFFTVQLIVNLIYCKLIINTAKYICSLKGGVYISRALLG